MDEFALIRRHFATLSAARDDVALGIGDDAALLQPPPGEALVVTSDMLIAGRHFPEGTAPADIGHKALAVNLSDLAAMGAQPRWFTLALSLPQADEAWLSEFARGLRELAQASDIALVGGDTTRGALTLSITAMGTVPQGQALRRSGAGAGDIVLVSGSIGDAALGLRQWQDGRAPASAAARWLRARLDRPTPRLALGRALRGIASAAIDLSDGLAGDLQHILDASGIGACIDADALPASPALRTVEPDADARRALQLNGGDDYELCVCVPAARLADAQRAADAAGVVLTAIGRIEAAAGLRVVGGGGRPLAFTSGGYRHF